MKKIAISLMAGMVLLTGCDLLNNDPDTDFTKQNYFTNEKNVELYCNYFYNEFSGYGNNGTYGVFYFPTLNDNQAEKGLTPWSYLNIPATSSTWQNSYKEIRRANILIEKLPGVEMAEANKNHWMGLARLYRGYQHYKLVRAFGDCYWVDKELTVNNATILYGKRTDRDEVMDKVLEDLNYAVGNMSLNGKSKTAFNVYVANAVKAEVCLYEGTFCKYRTAADNGKAADAARANKYLEEAKNACQVIMGGDFKLTDGAAGYRANYNSLDLAGNTEMIMYKKYILGTLAHGTQDYCCGSTPTKGMSKAAFNAYLKLDGTVADPNDDHGTLRVDTIVINDTTTIIDTVYTIESILANRDPRLAQQVDEDLRYVGKGRIRYRFEPGQSGAAENTSYTGYGVLKFDEPKTVAKNRQATNGNETDAPIFWLAEIYLDYAEACAEMGNITQDDLDKSVNMLRNRVGMPNLTLSPAADPANNMGVSDLIWEIRRERRVEMMYDKDDRYWSLIRWHQLDKLDTKNYPEQTLGAWIDSAWKYDKENVVLNADRYIDCKGTSPDRIFDKKYYLEPIPSGQSSLNPEIGQNLGW